MQRFFFIHVQKTAGTSFREQINATFDREQIYPLTGVSMDEYLTAYVDGRALLALSQEERDAFTLIHGHFPFVTSQRAGGDRITITILRDPVDRVESLLRMNTRVRPQDADKTLEEIYDDEAVFEMQVKDHQAKVFAVGPDDDTDNALHLLDVDDARLRVAKEHLEQVDIVAFQDDVGALMQRMTTRYGWSGGRAFTRQNVNDAVPLVASDALRRRIAADNPADQEFWEFAKQLRARRGDL